MSNNFASQAKAFEIASINLRRTISTSILSVNKTVKKALQKKAGQQCPALIE
jgi:hypothetical protein